jgi:uncharacterized alkaline shock family protein YloU
MNAQPLISSEVLARYAADAARQVEGVTGLLGGTLDRGGGKGVAIAGAESAPAVEVHVELEWGRSAADVSERVQARVAEYLERMANVTPASVDVVVGGVGSPPAKR